MVMMLVMMTVMMMMMMMIVDMVETDVYLMLLINDEQPMPKWT